MRACFSAVALLLVCGARAFLMPEAIGESRLTDGYRSGRTRPHGWFPRERRTSHVPQRIVDPVSTPEDCFLMYLEEGELFYKAGSSDGPVCGIYLISPQDKKIEVVFTYLDVPCEEGGVVEWVDGWQLNGQVWPADSWSDDRVAEVCGHRRPRRVFVSRQNAALLQYRVPARGKGFSVRVRHVHSSRPCNVMLYGESGVHTIRNYGGAQNCSVVSLGPAAVQVLALDVGRAYQHPNTIEVETGTIHHCSKRGLADHVDIGGASGLDNTNMKVFDSLCGLNSNQEALPALIGCQNTVVRLVSSGLYHNSATVSFQPMDLGDVERVNFMCEE